MQEKNKIVIFTYYTTALPLLNFLKKTTNIKAIVIPINRDNDTLFPIIDWAKKNHIIYLKTENCNNKEIVNKIKKLNPDLNVIFNFPQIFKDDLLKITRTINFHPGDLPKYRGAHVINWALINGEKRIAITCHFVTKGIDSGNIIAKKYLNIKATDNIMILSKKVAQAVPILAKIALKKIADPNFLGEKQDFKKSTYYSRRKPEDGQINWLLKANEIHNLVRALTGPWPGAFTFVNEKKIIVDKIKIRKYPKLKQGEHRNIGGGLFFGSADNTIEIVKWH